MTSASFAVGFSQNLGTSGYWASSVLTGGAGSLRTRLPIKLEQWGARATAGGNVFGFRSLWGAFWPLSGQQERQNEAGQAWKPVRLRTVDTYVT